MQNNITIKSLQRQLLNLKEEIEAKKVLISNTQKEINAQEKLIENLSEKIGKLTKPNNPTVSEHAIIRYFERVLGYDIEEIKEKILTDEVVNMVEKLGRSGKYPNGNFRVVMKDNVVVTITE